MKLIVRAAVLLAVILTNSSLWAKKAFISDCITPSTYGTVTFICDHKFHAINFFSSEPRIIHCSNSSTTFPSDYVAVIQFLGCQMTQIPYEFFATFSNVYKLNISSLGLEQLSPNVLTRAKALARLIASHNKLTVIRVAQFGLAANLLEVDMSFNEITKIEDGAFDQTLQRLWLLDLSHNAIQSIPPGTFSHLTNLLSLMLSHNRINRISSETFASLLKLRALDLSHNEIQSNVWNLSLRNLQRLDLAHNSIERLTFDSMRRLHFVNLSHNQVHEIESGAFVNQTNLKSLNLSFNHIERVDLSAILPATERMERLDLAGNPFVEVVGYDQRIFPKLKVSYDAAT